jgi:hypothetical protein|eukprot:COSAG02_NODE_238_length_27685_cov_11.570792_14_plen_269_part_00
MQQFEILHRENLAGGLYAGLAKRISDSEGALTAAAAELKRALGPVVSAHSAAHGTAQPAGPRASASSISAVVTALCEHFREQGLPLSEEEARCKLVELVQEQQGEENAGSTAAPGISSADGPRRGTSDTSSANLLTPLELVDQLRTALALPSSATPKAVVEECVRRGHCAPPVSATAAGTAPSSSSSGTIRERLVESCIELSLPVAQRHSAFGVAASAEPTIGVSVDAAVERAAARMARWWGTGAWSAALQGDARSLCILCAYTAACN